MEKYVSCLTQVKNKMPLILHLTNFVTAESCANITICFGASPIMGNESEDINELANSADALVLNIGTVDNTQLDAMLRAAKIAEIRGIPILLDPVGAGATKYRTDAALKLLKYATIIKGNAGEISALAGEKRDMKGVDFCGTSENIQTIACRLATELHKIIIVSGKKDIITDGTHCIQILNGNKMMSRVSGTGCMASSVCAAFSTVSNNIFETCVSAMAYFGIAGEKAATKSNGPGSFKTAFFDEAASITENDFIHAKIEVCT